MKDLLSQEEIKKLIYKYQEENDEDALIVLVNKNMGLVNLVANKYKNLGVDYEDLVEEGKIGLIRAIQKFDYNQEYSFSTYAIYWIRHNISRFALENSKNIKIPFRISSLIGKYQALKNALAIKYNRIPSKEEIATGLGISLKRLDELELYLQKEISINQDLYEDESEILNFIPDNTNVFEEVYKKEKVTGVNEILEKSNLTEREKTILKYRFGLNSTTPKTLENIASIMNLTRERIRQIEAKALSKLRNPKYAKELIGYLGDNLTLDDYCLETLNGKCVYKLKTNEENLKANDMKTFLQELLINYTEEEIKNMLKRLNQEDLKIIAFINNKSGEVESSFYGYLLPKIKGILQSNRLNTDAKKLIKSNLE